MKKVVKSKKKHYFIASNLLAHHLISSNDQNNSLLARYGYYVYNIWPTNNINNLRVGRMIKLRVVVAKALDDQQSRYNLAGVRVTTETFLLRAGPYHEILFYL